MQSDEESSSSECFNPVGGLAVFKHSSIRKDFHNNSWKLCSPKSLFDL